MRPEMKRMLEQRQKTNAAAQPEIEANAAYRKALENVAFRKSEEKRRRALHRFLKLLSGPF